mmetsp:Transcript_22989/g.52114  ORF Transcript_22989/g.52114 Transcript_22989/m.52114 type:complete len:81 (+) Transcript_22989:248-490(+)
MLSSSVVFSFSTSKLPSKLPSTLSSTLPALATAAAAPPASTIVRARPRLCTRSNCLRFNLFLELRQLGDGLVGRACHRRH